MMTLTTHLYAHYHNEILTSLHSLVLGACSPCLVGSSLSDPPARVGHELGAAVVESGALFSLALVAVVSHGLSAAAARVLAVTRRGRGGASISARRGRGFGLAVLVCLPWRRTRATTRR